MMALYQVSENKETKLKKCRGRSKGNTDARVQV